MQLTGQIIQITDVSPVDRRQMFELMRRNYDNITSPQFDSDLNEKDWVIVTRHPGSGHVMGFSTQQLYDQDTSEGPIKVLFSGDTIVDPEFWGSNPLAKLWGQLTLALMDKHLGQDLFWFLISKGYKTYRFLPVFFNEFFPRLGTPTPQWATNILNGIAQEKFGDRFEIQRGIVRAAEDGCRLKPNIADISHRASDRNVRFFESANPGHARGDELCCLARLSRKNFKASAWKVIGSSVTANLSLDPDRAPNHVA